MMMQRTANENAACKRRMCKRSDQPNVKSLTGQRHYRVQTESQQLQPWTAISTLLGLVNTV